MNKETLEQIKKDYTDMDKISRGDFSEIIELEKNPIVQRYNYLLDIKKSYSGTNDYYRESHIFGEIINKYSNGLIEQTNNIWFWFCNMSIKEYEKMFGTSLDNDDKDSTIAVYIDLENSKKVTTIPINKQLEFESTNNVIRGKRTIIDSTDRYYNARYEFFNACVNEGQDLAVKMMIQKELSRSEENGEGKEQKLIQLKTLLNIGAISEEEYSRKKQIVLSKR